MKLECKAFGALCELEVFTINDIEADYHDFGTKEDIDAIENACSLGVSVIATAHSDKIETLKKKPNFERIFDGKLFSRFIVLSSKNGLGTVDGIYDENFFPLYLGENR